MPHVRPSAQFSYKALENEYLQAIVDWGIPGAAAAGVCLIFLALLALSRWRRSPVEAGCIAGLVAIGLQGVVDFGLSMPGVAMPVVAVLAFLTAGKLEGRAASRSKGLVAAFVVAGAALISVAALPFATPLRDEAENPDIAEARAMWRRHPAYYRGAGLVATHLLREQNRAGVKVLGRALEANRAHSGLQLLAARTFVNSTSKEQALEHFAAALENASPGRVKDLVTELIAEFPDAKQAARGLPRSADRLIYVSRALLQAKRGDLLLAHLRDLAFTDSSNPEVFLALSKAALRQGEVAEAEKSARRSYRLANDAESLAQLSKVLIRIGNGGDALVLIAEHRKGHLPAEDLRALALSEAKVLLSLNKFVESAERLEEAAGMAAGDSRALAAIHRVRAELEEAQGNHNRAKLERQKARELEEAAKRRR
jgi:tetratricopeptide (TPR) repeat protein